MAIKIKQHKEAWVLEISDEEWQFDDRKKMEEALNSILDIKQLNGRVKY